MNTLRHAIPILRVSDLRASLAYYINTLGFKLDWEHPSRFASVSRDRCCLFLCEGDQGHLGTWTWTGVDDVDALCAEFQRNGAIIRHPPTNYEWAYEMQVADPDGNILRFGAEAKAGQPTGEWLDMAGRIWPTSEGPHI
jgi:catechol 2,3-dioxygenase-like lactoylglutathione lyase family enzyme